MTKKGLVFTALAMIALSSPAFAQSKNGCFVTEANAKGKDTGERFYEADCAKWTTHVQSSQGSEGPTWMHATVQKVDARHRRVVLAHAAMPDMQMPAMTVVAPVKDKAHLAKLHAGSDVDVLYEISNGVMKVLSVR